MKILDELMQERAERSKIIAKIRTRLTRLGRGLPSDATDVEVLERVLELAKQGFFNPN